MNTGLLLNDDGWLVSASRRPSPYYDARALNAVINTLVIHNIALPPNTFGQNYIDALFAGELAHHQGVDPFIDSISAMRVSAHFLIARDGGITQYVSTLDRAWHAGESVFDGQSGCNDFSVGVELNGADHIPYTLRQYQALAKLAFALMARHPLITLERITTHAHIAPMRKTDPGPSFHHGFFRRLLKDG